MSGMTKSAAKSKPKKRTKTRKLAAAVAAAVVSTLASPPAAGAKATILDGKKLYKVLSATGESQNGGALKWSLPGPNGPGEFHEVPAVLICNRGLHLTAEPARWWKANSRVFEVEAEHFGEQINWDGKRTKWHEDKVVAQRVRLVRELSESELASVGIFKSGYHEVKENKLYIAEGSAQVTANGSAKVTAYGSAQVTANDSAQVTANDSAQVTAYGSAKVTANDSAQVTANGSAQVTANDSAKVTANDSAKVTAYGSAQVTANDSAKVTAYGSAQVTGNGKSLIGTWAGSMWYSNMSAVTLADDAVHVDYRSGKPEFKTAPPKAETGATAEAGAR
jgi:hypothetical protein